MATIPGRELIRLLVEDGWGKERRDRHGWKLTKWDDHINAWRRTTVSDTAKDLPTGTLAAILGPEQTGLGSAGLRRLRHNRKGS